MGQRGYTLTRSGYQGRQLYTSYNSATGKWEPHRWEESGVIPPNLSRQTLDDQQEARARLPIPTELSLGGDVARSRRRVSHTLQQPSDSIGLSLGQPGTSRAGAGPSTAFGDARSRSGSRSSSSDRTPSLSRGF